MSQLPTIPVDVLQTRVDAARADLEHPILRSLFADDSMETSAAAAVLVAGPPRSGKTALAIAATQRAMEQFGQARVLLAVSTRTLADEYSPLLIRHTGVSSQARPATTLNALAFRLLTAQRAHVGEALPRLLNGAQQDMLLRRVLSAHITHVQSGDTCGTCALLRDYFANEQWMQYVADDLAMPDTMQEPASTASMLMSGINASFVAQLRDMLARLDESEITPSREQEVLAALDHTGITGARLAIQWRLAFALRREYIATISEQYPHEYRLDSSFLPIAGARAARELERTTLPAMVVIDDVQDVTLAGFALVRALHERGVRLLCIGNPDESVQTFRGSNPDYVMSQLQTQCDAQVYRLPDCAHESFPDFRHTVAARVSLSIASNEIQDTPLPQRMGKAAVLPHAFPITPVVDDRIVHDGSLHTALYRSAREELDTVVWQIKTEQLTGHRPWNDMAVIMHDNAALRILGDRLRRDGVPVRFSSVSKPLIEEPFVQGLFALIELAQLRNTGVVNTTMTPTQIARFVQSRVHMIAVSPLLDRSNTPLAPMDMAPIHAAMRSIQVVSQVDTQAGEADSSSIAAIVAQWHALDTAMQAHRDALAAQSQVRVDESIIDPDEHPLEFGMDALYIMLAHNGAPDVMDAIEHICGTAHTDETGHIAHASNTRRRFTRLWELVDRIAHELATLQDASPQFALEAAWIACDVASRWQQQALYNTPEGRAANDRLDTAMRLFEYVDSEQAGTTISTCIDQIRNLAIEADSLAHVAPIDDAITLTTPAGAAGRSWDVVWMPGIQQDTWPNLAPRNTMFGGEDLVDVVLHGALDEQREIAMGSSSNLALAAVLATEQKSFLVALTRANETVRLSAAYNDETTPSDFLYTYVPECYDRVRDDGQETRQYTAVSEQPTTLLNADTRGLVAIARTSLATAHSDPAIMHDAEQALATLATQGHADVANPTQWPFVDDWGAPHNERGDEPEAQASAPAQTSMPSLTVSLSPSQVDNLWGCPVCARMEHDFFGPVRSSVSVNFGSIIHDIAQQATLNDWDMPSFLDDVPPDERITAITDRMMALYEETRINPEDIDDPQQRYLAVQKDTAAKDTLHNIASYFVNSNIPERYDLGNTAQFTVGTLQRADAEVRFTAQFSLADITAAYNAIPDITPISTETMMHIMGFLVGGWPEGMDPALTIRLNGRIDRREWRERSDGETVVRLIDYKTGKSYGGSMSFTDLQLVCYQLALAFPQTDRQQSSQEKVAALRTMPLIAQSALFSVQEAAFPANRGQTPEGYFQEPLFRDGHINTHAFTPRNGLPSLMRVWPMPSLDEVVPGVDEHAWAQFMDLRDSMAVWSLTMIARIFYAAAAMRSDTLAAQPTERHLQYCKHKTICPACNARIATVFETRED